MTGKLFLEALCGKFSFKTGVYRSANTKEPRAMPSKQISSYLVNFLFCFVHGASLASDLCSIASRGDLWLTMFYLYKTRLGNQRSLPFTASLSFNDWDEMFSRLAHGNINVLKKISAENPQMIRYNHFWRWFRNSKTCCGAATQWNIVWIIAENYFYPGAAVFWYVDVHALLRV